MKFHFNPFRNGEKEVLKALKKKNPSPVSEKLPYFKGLLAGARAAQKDTARVIGMETRLRKDGEKPWGAYRESLEEHLSPGIKRGLSELAHPGLKQKILAAIEKTHAQNRKAIALSLFGEESGKSLGFDTTVTVSLTSSNSHDSSVESISSDALSPSTPHKLNEKLSSIGGDLIYVHVDSVGGMDDLRFTKDGQKYTYSIKQLERLFNVVYEHLATPGFIDINTDAFIYPSTTEDFVKQLQERGIVFEMKPVLRRLLVIKK